MKNRNKGKLWFVITMIALIGFVVFSCDDGGNTKGSDPVCTHEWNAYVQTTAPTCTQAGVKTRTCKKCSIADAVTETGDDALGHEWDYSEGAILPTCEEGGHGSRECVRAGCGETEDDIDFDALGHGWGEWDITEAPNCVFAGVKTRVCDVCEKDETDEVGIDENGHDIEVLDGVAPTCLLDGHGTIKCKRETCEYTKTGDVLEKRGHNFIDHWEVVNAATCTTDGLEERFCTHECGETNNRETREIEALGHDWGNWTLNAVLPTCSDPGKDTASCKNALCFEVKERENSSATGHVWNWDSYTTGSGLRECQVASCFDTAGLGDIGPGGGKIYYVSETGFTQYTSASDTTGIKAHYLEVAPAGWTTMSGFDWMDPQLANDAVNAKNIPNTGYLIGTGRKNTALIRSGDPNAQAARYCVEYRGGGKTDWFLPCRDEVIGFLNNRSYVGDIANGQYWTSTQGNNVNGSMAMYGRLWSNGEVEFGTDYKNKRYLVRPIRAF